MLQQQMQLMLQQAAGKAPTGDSAEADAADRPCDQSVTITSSRRHRAVAQHSTQQARSSSSDGNAFVGHTVSCVLGSEAHLAELLSLLLAYFTLVDVLPAADCTNAHSGHVCQPWQQVTPGACADAVAKLDSFVRAAAAPTQPPVEVMDAFAQVCSFVLGAEGNAVLSRADHEATNSPVRQQLNSFIVSVLKGLTTGPVALHTQAGVCSSAAAIALRKVPSLDVSESQADAGQASDGDSTSSFAVGFSTSSSRRSNSSRQDRCGSPHG